MFKKQRPGEPPTVDNSRNLVRALFFDPKRYDLTRVGRYKLNMRLGVRGLARVPRSHHRRHRRAGEAAGRPAGQAGRARGEQGLRRRRVADPARRDRARPGRVRALRQPPAAHRRRADPGGLPDRPLPHGAGRPRAPHHRGRGRDHAADDRQHPPGGRRAEGVLRLLAAVPVHGSDQLPGRAHAPPPPVGAGRRRPHPRARADRGARRAPDPLRADVPDRDAGGSRTSA